MAEPFSGRTIFGIGSKDRKDDDASNDLLLRIAASAAHAKRTVRLKEMKRYLTPLLIAGTVTALLLIVVLVNPFLRWILLDYIDPVKPKEAYVLTTNVILQSGGGVTITLPAGTVLHGPCRHDLGYTEPFDPRIWKLYIDGEYNDFSRQSDPISVWTNGYVRRFDIKELQQDGEQSARPYGSPAAGSPSGQP